MPPKQARKRQRVAKSPSTASASASPSSSKSTKTSSTNSTAKATALPSAGYLLTCDAPTKQYIKSVNESKTNDKRFIIEDLDPTHLLVKEKAREEILRKVEEWMDKNVFSNIERVGENLET